MKRETSTVKYTATHITTASTPSYTLQATAQAATLRSYMHLTICELSAVLVCPSDATARARRQSPDLRPTLYAQRDAATVGNSRQCTQDTASRGVSY